MTDFVTQICGALEKTGSNNTKDIKEATDFLQQAQQTPGCLANLLTIVMKPQEVAKLASDQKPEMICLRAVSLLKTIVNVSWDKPEGSGGSVDDKENVQSNINNGEYQIKATISLDDRNFIKENIYEALGVAMFTLQNKNIQKEIENVFYNIAQNEFAEGSWNEVLPKICSLLQMQDENWMIIGLRLLQELLRAFELSIDEKGRKVMVSICEQTYPILESILTQVQQSQSANQPKIMISLCKIFLLSNQMKILPFLLQPGKMAGWINFFIAILQFHQEGDLTNLTNDFSQIQQLDKHEYWKLKAIVCKINNKLLAKYQQNSNIHRFNDVKSQKSSERTLLLSFQKEFATQYLSKLIETHVEIIISKQGQFVGTKTLALSIKVCSASLAFKQARQVINQYVEKILFEISLPLFMTTQQEIQTFTEDPIEYIRMQYSNSNEMNVKKQLSLFVQKLCSLKAGKKNDNQTSKHLSKYMETIFTNLNSMQGQDQETEALLMAFGNLHQKAQWNGKNMYLQVQQIMWSFTFPHLKSSSVLLQARACQLYAQYGVYEFQEQSHLEQATNLILGLLWSDCIVVRVEAAMALSSLLKHQQAVVGFLRPGLGNVLKMYLKIMDEIDFEELVGALRIIVDTYEDEIAPYAVSLCQKLSEAYCRLIQNSVQEDVETEAGLTADGLMSAIRRVLNSISGKFPKLYPQLEEILEQPIRLSLSEAGSTSADEGLSCIAELIYNQEGVSDRMWGLYFLIISSYVNNEGVLDDLISQASVPLINFMDKAGTVFRDSQIFNGQTALQLMFSFITKIFQDGTELCDEIHSMCAVTLIMALLEHIEGMDEHIHTINQLYLKEISEAEVQNYKNMLVQGIMMLFHYNLGATFSSLQQLGALGGESNSNILDFILDNTEKMDKDFEIKRMLIGLVTITLQPESSQLPQYVQEKFPLFTQAMVWLAQKSLEVRTKKNKKEEEAEDENCEKGVIYDEDDDEGYELNSNDDDEEDWDQSGDELDSDLYNTKLDAIDDIIFMRDALAKLQNNNPAHLQAIMSCLQPEQQQALTQAIAQAEALENEKQQAEAKYQQELAANPQSEVQQIDLS